MNQDHDDLRDLLPDPEETKQPKEFVVIKGEGKENKPAPLKQRYQLINFQGRLHLMNNKSYEISPIDKDRAKHEYTNKGIEECPYISGYTTDSPDNFNYTPIIDDKLNANFPLPYKPKPGNWKTIEQTLKHVFGDQYEHILMYHKIMLEHPHVKLPLILLLSSENETGKSSVLELTARMMGKNSTKIRPSELGRDGKFNGRYATKQFGYVDEQNVGVDKFTALSTIKDMVTAEELVAEEKNQKAQTVTCNIKIMMASNDVHHAVPIEASDTRIWPVHVPRIRKENMMNRATYKELMYSEIPHYVHYLQTELTYEPSSHRLHFDHKMYMTELKKDIIRNNKSTVEEELLTIIHEAIGDRDYNEISAICFKIGTANKLLSASPAHVRRTIEEMGWKKSSGINQNKGATVWELQIDGTIIRMRKPIRGYRMEYDELMTLLEA